MNDKKWIYLLLAAVIVTASGAFLAFDGNEPEQQHQAKQNPAVVAQKPNETAPSSLLAVLGDPEALPKRAAEPPVQAVEPKSQAITPADWHEVAKWQLSLGRSLDQLKIYKDYDKETLLALAAQGDIFALQEGSYIMLRKGDRAAAHKMLNEAAARGSTQALIMAGLAIENDFRMLRDGDVSEEKIKEAYDIEVHDMPLEKALEIMAAGHYVVAAIRGDIQTAHEGLIAFQRHSLGRELTDEDRKSTYTHARFMYDQISAQRSELGFDEFDNDYPKEYAEIYGLPRENTLLEDITTQIQ